MIPGIILAAGKSSRMGRTKALLRVGADTFLSRIARTMLDGGVDEVVVVVGADAESVRAAAAAMPVGVVENPDYERGQLSSLVTALRAVDRPGVRAAMVTLIDVPLVAPGTVRTLLREYEAGSSLIVRPSSRGRHGHPVIFDRSLFNEFYEADPAEGAKTVMRSYLAEQLNVDIDDEGAFTDVDTPEDYERLIANRR